MNTSKILMRSSTTQTRKSLALAVCAALCAASAFGPTVAAAPADSQVAVAQPTPLRPGDAVTGALPMTQPIHIEVALKMRDRAGLDAFIDSRAASAAKGVFAPPMTSEQFLATHAPTQQQTQAVVDYLTAHGYTNVRAAPNRMLVSADGTARTARDAFSTTFAQVRTREGRIAFANTDAVRIPASLSDKVLAVVGLQSVHVARTYSYRVDTAGTQASQIVGHEPTEFPTIYGGTGAAAATDVVVGIVSEGSLTQTLADLNTFTTDNSLSTVSTTIVNTNGTSSDTSGTPEWDLDSQDIVGMSGGVNKLIFYNIPSLLDSDLTADFNTIVAANQTKIINVSLGLCELGAQSDGSATTDDQTFATAVAQGQTFSIATGDKGADECSNGGTDPSWPAASQYVVAAAGTKLATDATTDAWSSETVWNELATGNGGTGGSPSTFETEPSWQKSFSEMVSGVTHTVPGTTRDVADIAFDADGFSGAQIIVGGSLAQYGGTSLAAPLFAGTWARVLHQYPTIGFAAPVLYALPRTAFHDITVGNNNGETAGLSYDSASGRGSLVINNLIKYAKGLGNQPPVANFSFVATGLSVNFTDTSTDPDGNIASHAWTFGDSGTSTSTNPNHVYSTAGTYSVSETVKDKVGASNTKTESVTVGGTELLQNTGFETGVATPWLLTAGILTNNSSLAHAGNWFLAIGGGSGAHTDHATQTVTIPSGKTVATLSFYLRVFTSETTTTMANDKLYVRVLNSAGNLLGTLATYSNLNTTTGYVQHSLNMAPYIGQTVRVQFLGVNNATLPTSWYLDDVTLVVQ